MHICFEFEYVCTQGLVIPADAVSTPYSYRMCILYAVLAEGETSCLEYRILEGESAPLVPPFAYNNQCGSVVLTSYIPVFLLGYSIQLVLPLIVLAVLTNVSHDSMPSSVHKVIHGIIWPEYWLSGSDDVLAVSKLKALGGGDSGDLLNMRPIFCNDVCNNWLLMVTFGLCSPVLAVAIVCSVLLKMSLWVMLVGRFTRCMLHDGDGGGGHSSDSCVDSNMDPDANAVVVTSRTTVPTPTLSSETFARGGTSNIADKNRNDVVLFALTALAEKYISLLEVLTTSFWRVVWFSAIFVALLSWDMAMDEVGWQQSGWVPLVPLCYGVVLRCTAHLFFHASDSSARDSMQQDSAEKRAASHDGDAGVSLSPLHIDKL